MKRPLHCPFCRHRPAVVPENPKVEGNAWGAVVCLNEDCPTYDYAQRQGVKVKDGEDVADERGSDAYKNAAVMRWNRAILKCRAVRP